MSNATTPIDSPTETKTIKRPRELSIAITEARPAKKNCRLRAGSLSVPKNNGQKYEAERQENIFYTFTPSDKSNINRARDGGYMDRVVYGCHAHGVVEKLIVDARMNTPWQVPKVTVEFRSIDYVVESQEYSERVKAEEGAPVSPTTTRPSLQQMSKLEYEEAVEVWDPRLALEAPNLHNFCQDTGIDWLIYENRFKYPLCEVGGGEVVGIEA